MDYSDSDSYSDSNNENECIELEYEEFLKQYKPPPFIISQNELVVIKPPKRRKRRWRRRKRGGKKHKKQSKPTSLFSESNTAQQYLQECKDKNQSTQLNKLSWNNEPLQYIHSCKDKNRGTQISSLPLSDKLQQNETSYNDEYSTQASSFSWKSESKQHIQNCENKNESLQVGLFSENTKPQWYTSNDMNEAAQVSSLCRNNELKSSTNSYNDKHKSTQASTFSQNNSASQNNTPENRELQQYTYSYEYTNQGAHDGSFSMNNEVNLCTNSYNNTPPNTQIAPFSQNSKPQQYTHSYNDLSKYYKIFKVNDEDIYYVYDYHTRKYILLDYEYFRELYLEHTQNNVYPYFQDLYCLRDPGAFHAYLLFQESLSRLESHHFANDYNIRLAGNVYNPYGYSNKFNNGLNTNILLKQVSTNVPKKKYFSFKKVISNIQSISIQFLNIIYSKDMLIVCGVLAGTHIIIKKATMIEN